MSLLAIGLSERRSRMMPRAGLITGRLPLRASLIGTAASTSCVQSWKHFGSELERGRSPQPFRSRAGVFCRKAEAGKHAGADCAFSRPGLGCRVEHRTNKVEEVLLPPCHDDMDPVFCSVECEVLGRGAVLATATVRPKAASRTEGGG